MKIKLFLVFVKVIHPEPESNWSFICAFNSLEKAKREYRDGLGCLHKFIEKNIEVEPGEKNEMSILR